MTAIFATVVEIWRKALFVIKWHPQKNCNESDVFLKTDKDIFIRKNQRDPLTKSVKMVSVREELVLLC